MGLTNFISSLCVCFKSSSGSLLPLLLLEDCSSVWINIVLAIIYSSSQTQTCITHLRWISGTNPTTHPHHHWLPPSPCRSSSKWKSKPKRALAGTADPSDLNTGNWQDSMKRHVLLLLTASLFVHGGASFCWDFHTSTLLCGQETELLCLQAAKLWIAVLRDGKCQPTPRLFVNQDGLLYFVYYVDLSSFKHSSSGGSAPCHMGLFRRGIWLFLRNSTPIHCWVFQWKHIYYSPKQNI